MIDNSSVRCKYSKARKSWLKKGKTQEATAIESRKLDRRKKNNGRLSFFFLKKEQQKIIFASFYSQFCFLNGFCCLKLG